MNRVAVKITMLWVFLSASAMSSSPAVLEVRVSVERLEWAHCGKPSSLKTFLKLDLINQSKESRTIGIIQVAQERFWHERRDGKLGLIRASPTADDFVPPDSPIASGEKEEQHLPSRGTTTVTLVHYVYATPADFQGGGKSRKIIVSFRVTNVTKDGGALDYWSKPISIVLPNGCAPQ